MPAWFASFIASLLASEVFFQLGKAIWDVLISVSTGLLKTNPAQFSNATWLYVTEELYPWAQGIGILSLNLFLLIGFCRSAENLKERVNLEMIIETLMKVVILNVLLLKGLTLIRQIFAMASAMAEVVIGIETPASFSQDVDLGSELFQWLFGLIYFIVAIICGILILFTLYQRYIKLYLLVVCFPLAVPTITGGRRIEDTAYAWFRSFIGNTFEVVVIALVMGISGKLIGGVSVFTSDNVILAQFDGLAQALNSMIQMILMAVSVKGASSFMSKTFNL